MQYKYIPLVENDTILKILPTACTINSRTSPVKVAKLTITAASPTNMGKVMSLCRKREIVPAIKALKSLIYY